MAAVALTDSAAMSSVLFASATTSSPIPLTTIFTPPPSCLNVVTYDGTSFWQNGISQTGDPNCYPASFYYIFNSYYTPGICPQQWTSVGQLPHSSGFDAACCPSSYFLYTTTGQEILNNVCASLIGTDLTNVFQTSTLADGPIPVSHQLKTISKADIPANSNTVWADVIQIQWQSSNMKVINLMASTASAAARSSSSSSSLSSSLSAAAPGSQTSSIPPPTSTSDSNNASSSSGLSTGAKAGIGVGIALGVIAMAAAAFLLFQYRRKRRANQYQEDHATEDYKRPGYHELMQNETGQAAPTEMDARNVNELPGTVMRPELDTKEPDRDSQYLSTSTPTPRHSQWSSS